MRTKKEKQKNFKIIIIIFFIIFILNSFDSMANKNRFGELTEIHDPKMRGKDNIWVRPHPGPFVWSLMEPEQNKFFWKDADEYVKNAQESNQNILATIWPYATWDQIICNKKKKVKSPFGKHFPKRLNKPCSMDNYLNFVTKLVDRYDGDGINDMPNLSIKINHWEIMNEPEFRMFFNGSSDEFIEIFKKTSNLIKKIQPNSKILMAGAAGMHKESKSYWDRVLPEIKNHFDIANIHHIVGPNGKCERDFWVSEFKQLLNNHQINKPIWVTEAMPGKCNAIKTYVNAFANGAEVIFDVGINAPGPKMKKKERKKLEDFIKNFNYFESIKVTKNSSAEFTFSNNIIKKIQY